MGIPVVGGVSNRASNLVTRIKASSLEGEGAQRFPAGFNQVQPGGVGRLEQETHTRMRQRPELDILCAMHRQIIQNEDHLPVRPMCHERIQKGQEVRRSSGEAGESHNVAAGWLETAPDPEFPTPDLVGRHRRTLPFRRPTGSQVSFDAQWSKRIQAQHLGLWRRGLLPRHDCPLFSPNWGRGAQ